MRIPFLDQIVELHRGDAHELQHVVGSVCLRIMDSFQAERPAPLPAGLLLAFPVLRRLVTRLGRLSQQEFFHVGLPRRRPHRFRLSYEETIALMLYVLPVATSAREPLGRVQQVSLNLDRFVDFPVSK